MNDDTTSTPVAQTWDTSQLVLSAEQVIIAIKLQAWLSVFPSPLAQAIAKFECGTFTPDQMRILEQGVIKHFRPLQSASQVLQVLCKVVDAINIQSLIKLPIPRIPNLSIRPKNPFHTGIPASLARARIWRETTIKNIGLPQQRSAAPISSSKSVQMSELGKLFTSSILHGGLADAALLVALARSLSDPNSHFVMVNDRLVIDLSISWKGEAGSEYRYWHPDVLTATLISRLADGSVDLILLGIGGIAATDQHIQKLIWQSISAYFRSTNLKKLERPRSLEDMVRTVQVDLQTRLPQVLANYAGRKLISHSPRKYVLARLQGLTMAQPTEHQMEKERSLPTELITEFNQIADNFNDIEPNWLNGLRKCFSSEKSVDVKKQLDALPDNTGISSVETCFREFAYFLMTSLSVGGHKLAISTAKSYLMTVAKRLGGRLGETDPRTLSTETLENLYGEILEDANSISRMKRQRRGIARALCEFHHFMVSRFQLEPINPREVLGIGKGLVPVDANLITPDEYEQIYQIIPVTIKSLHPSIPEQAKLTKAAQLIFMLSFRCGLRRMEVLMLKMIDFSEHDPAELLVRPSEARQLKTKSSTRKMPLYVLLSVNELADLRNWKDARRTEIIESPLSVEDPFLFGIPKLDYQFIPQETVFPIIHHAMRGVTGDKSMRFHHLRHSFASWTFLRLMLSDLHSTHDLFPHLPTTTEFLKESKSFRDKLYGRSDPTRRHVYAVASLLGHSGPDISLEHYVHFCDVLLALWLAHDASAPTRKTIIREAVRPTSTIYRWVAQGLPHIPYRLIKKRWPLQTKKSLNSTVAAPPPPQTIVMKTMLDLNDSKLFDKVWNFLYQHEMHKTPIDELSASIGIPEDVAVMIVQKATEIRDMKTSRGRGGYRHRMIEVALDRRHKSNTSRLACPIAPHTENDKKIANQLVPRLFATIKSKSELCREVFDFYLSNSWQTRNELVFKDPENPMPALQFIQFLDELGIKKSDINFVSYDISTRSSALALWKIKLGLSWRQQISKIAPPRKTNNSAQKWLGIKPVFITLEKRNANSCATSEGSIAFRYLMVIGSIIISVI